MLPVAQASGQEGGEDTETEAEPEGKIETVAGPVEALEPPSVPITRAEAEVLNRKLVRSRRNAGFGLLLAGGFTAASGFLINASTFLILNGDTSEDIRRVISEEDRAVYDTGRTLNIVGLGIGIAGATMSLTGFFVMIAPQKNKAQLSVAGGPITSVTLKF